MSSACEPEQAKQDKNLIFTPFAFEFMFPFSYKKKNIRGVGSSARTLHIFCYTSICILQSSVKFDQNIPHLVS